MSSATSSTATASSASLKQAVARHPLLAYFALAIAFTWLTALPVLVSQNGLGLFAFTLPFAPFQMLGAFTGPLLAAFVVTAAADGRPGVTALLGRMTRWRVGLPWYLIAVLGYVLLDLLIGALVSGAAALEAFAQKWPLIFTLYFPALLTSRLINPIGEEAGWTGFALPRVQRQFGPWLGAIILSLVWAVWHLPAFFVPSEMGKFDPIGFVFFIILSALTRLIWTWVVNRAQGSGLIGVLLHASSNANGLDLRTQLYPPAPPEAGLIAMGVTLVIAVAILIATRGRLAYTKSEQKSPAL
jgi:membrane protease YdiL (CAAX protease family)